MSTAAVEVLEMLSSRMIDLDEAIRLLKAIKKATGRTIATGLPASSELETQILMEMVGSSIRPNFGYGNIIAR